jgi:hypothetical protein
MLRRSRHGRPCRLRGSSVTADNFEKRVAERATSFCCLGSLVERPCGRRRSRACAEPRAAGAAPPPRAAPSLAQLLRMWEAAPRGRCHPRAAAGSPPRPSSRLSASRMVERPTPSPWASCTSGGSLSPMLNPARSIMVARASSTAPSRVRASRGSKWASAPALGGDDASMFATAQAASRSARILARASARRSRSAWVL